MCQDGFLKDFTFFFEDVRGVLRRFLTTPDGQVYNLYAKCSLLAGAFRRYRLLVWCLSQKELQKFCLNG